MSLFFYRGKLQKEIPFNLDSLFIQFGSCIVESMYYHSIMGDVPFWFEHKKRLIKAVKIFPSLKLYMERLEKELRKALSYIQNKGVKKPGRIKLIFFPEKEWEWVICYIPSERLKKSIILRDDNIVLDYPLRKLKTNHYFHIIKDITSGSVSDTCIKNKNKKVVEAARGNIILFNNKTLWYISTSENHLEGVYQKMVLKIAKDHYQLKACNGFELKTMIKADALFYCNAAAGLIYVRSFLTKSYKKQDKICNMLNRKIFDQFGKGMR